MTAIHQSRSLERHYIFISTTLHRNSIDHLGHHCSILVFVHEIRTQSYLRSRHQIIARMQKLCMLKYQHRSNLWVYIMALISIPRPESSCASYQSFAYWLVLLVVEIDMKSKVRSFVLARCKICTIPMSYDQLAEFHGGWLFILRLK